MIYHAHLESYQEASEKQVLFGVCMAKFTTLPLYITRAFFEFVCLLVSVFIDIHIVEKMDSTLSRGTESTQSICRNLFK